jgi:ubiquinone biosynthesis protein UbiJ
MENTVWNVILSAGLGLLSWVLKDKADELARITILLNRTREEIAKEYVTKVEVHADINRVLDRLDRLDEKLDRLMEKRHAEHQ